MPEGKYIAHGPLGRLVRWLRLLGFDVLFLPEASPPDVEMASFREGRRILTRVRGFATPRTILIENDRVRDQVREFLLKSGERVDKALLFSRCALCNSLLQDVTRERAREEGVPEYVLFTCETFRFCPACRRVYWPGTHRERFLAQLSEVIEGG
ncbi:MAG: hypothetical protein D6713_07720 [Deltaproteobacteria bacterium]|nr:MAG: hypothetical protein D6713_07720 [Deltaproteobacteria bacterium]